MECSKEKRGKSFTKQAVKRVGALAETMPDLAKEWHPTKMEHYRLMIFRRDGLSQSGGFAHNVATNGKQVLTIVKKA